MKKQTFLLEIGVEELPPKLLKLISESILKNIIIELNNIKIKYEKINWFATPRRIAIIIYSLNEYQDDIFLEKKGPKLDKAFEKNGKPTLATIKWANINNININNINNYINKNKYLFLKKNIKGKLSNTLLCNVIKKSLEKINFLKKMYWGNNKILFIRPVHNIILLLDDNIINGNILGIESNRFSYGHRFMGEKKINIDNAKIYKQKLLENGFVIVDYIERKEKIIKEIEFNAKNINGLIYLKNNLLEEITSLVEWPVILTGEIDEKYLLSIPSDIIKHIMEKKFKYIPVYDKKNNKITKKFIFIINIISKNPNKIKLDNEKVINSKLKDIEFFLKEDSKIKLEENILKLKDIYFYQELGNYFDKILRIKVLSSWIANIIGANIKHTMRSALLSKCDLVTNMVFEFPDLQGIIGMQYALNNNENRIVALAQKEQYKPKFANDNLPTTKVSFALSIADKIDTIVGIFIIGKYIKGYQDPFALRRLVLGVIRIIIENNLNLNLNYLIEESINLYKINKSYDKKINEKINNFIYSRLKTFYVEKGFNKEIIQSIFKNINNNKKLIEINKRILLLINLKKSDKYNEILEIYKRTSNILEKSKISNLENFNIKKYLLKEKEEIILYKNIEILENKISIFLKNDLLEDIFNIIYDLLYIEINNFFKKIIILTDDILYKMNRLSLLYKIKKIFLIFADFSFLNFKK